MMNPWGERRREKSRVLEKEDGSEMKWRGTSRGGQLIELERA